LLPYEVPPWQTVYWYQRTLRTAGVWEQIHTVRRGKARRLSGRKREPRGCIIDSQSIKTTERDGERGYGGGQKLNSRKRHLLVVTTGLILKACVHSAAVPDREGGLLLLQTMRERFPHLRQVWADMGYRGSAVRWITERLGWKVNIVPQPRRWFRVPEGVEPPYVPPFVVLPRRWIVERTFAWLGRYRRLSKDYEYLSATSEALIYAAMCRLTLHRITHIVTLKTRS
jgi:transposase